MTAINFNTQQYEPEDFQSFSPIPDGEYLAMIVETEVKETQSKTGQYIKVVWQILDGEFKDRKIFDNITLANPNKQAEEIGQRRLTRLCVECGINGILENTEQLHDHPMIVSVAIEAQKDDPNKKNNRIKKFQSADGEGAAIPSAAPAKTTTRASTASSTAAGKSSWRDRVKA